MLSAPFLTALLLFVALSLNFALVYSLPRRTELQSQRWKISILFGLVAFLIWPLMIVAMQVADGVEQSAPPTLATVLRDLLVVADAAFKGACLGLWFSLLIIALVYAKFQWAPWDSAAMAPGAALFDRLIGRLSRILRRFHRAA